MTAGEPARGRMGRTLLWVFIAVLLLVARPVPAPVPLRAAAALVAFLLLPGAGLALAWPGLLREGWGVVPALAWPLSMIWGSLVVGGGAILGWPLLSLGAIHLFGTFTFLLLGFLSAERRRPDPVGPGPGAALLATVAIAVLLAAWAGAPVSPASDGPDHVNAIREILLTGDFFPPQGLVADGEIHRADPRKGTLHGTLALAGAVAGLPAHRLWPVLPAVLLVSFLPLVHLLGVRFGGPGAAGWLSALLALIFLGGEGGRWVLRLGYGAHAAMVLSWAGTALLFRFADGGGRWLWPLLVLVAATTGAVHPMGPVFLLAPAALLAIGVPGAESGTRRRWIAGGVAIAAGALPILALRYVAARGPLNPLHAQTMPVLEWGAGWTSLWPLEAARILGPAGLLAAGLAVIAPRFARGPIEARYLRVTAALALGLNLVPGVFDVAASAASSLPIKLLYLAPTPWVLAAFLVTPSGTGRRFVRLVVTLLLLVQVPGALAGFHPGRQRAGRPADAEEILQALREIPGRVVVATDPWFSSLVAAETPHYPVTVLHQHGHPLDARGLVRLNDLGTILSPWEPTESAVGLLRRYRSAFYVVPGGDAGAAEWDFAAARGGEIDAARRERALRNPERFTAVTPRTAGRIFRVDFDASPSADSAVWSLREGEVDGVPVAPSDGEARGVVLVSVEFPDTLHADEPVRAVLWWRRIGPEGGWPVEAHLRLRAVGTPSNPAAIRRLRALLPGAGPRDRWRWILPPFDGAWPVDAWPAGRDLPDTLMVPVPADLGPGEYEFSVRVLERPMFERRSLEDLFGSRDRWQGEPLGRVRME